MDERLLNDGKPEDELACARARRKAERGEELTEDDVAAVLRSLQPMDTREEFGEKAKLMSHEDLVDICWYQRGVVKQTHRGVLGLLHALWPGDDVRLRASDAWAPIMSLTMSSQGVKLRLFARDDVEVWAQVGSAYPVDSQGTLLPEFEARRGRG